jgi:hypothetical protein
MLPDRKRYNWTKMAETVKASEKKIWDAVRQAAGSEDQESIECQGYTLRPSGFKNFPPRLEFSASLDLPEDKDSDPRKVDNLMNHVAQESNSSAVSFRLSSQYHHPMMDALEKDPVFGKEPELPYGITYRFDPDRSQFEEK